MTITILLIQSMCLIIQSAYFLTIVRKRLQELKRLQERSKLKLIVADMIIAGMMRAFGTHNKRKQ